MLKLVFATCLFLFSLSISAQENCIQNQVDTNRAVDSLISNASPFFYSRDQDATNRLEKLKNLHQCEHGRGKDRVFQISSNVFNGNVISGIMSDGSSEEGSLEHYFGVNQGFKDILVISHVGDGKFNVLLSMCNQRVHSGGMTLEFVSDDIKFSDYHLDFAVLNTNPVCESGNISSANVRFMNPSFGQDGRSFTQACWQ